MHTQRVTNMLLAGRCRVPCMPSMGNTGMHAMLACMSRVYVVMLACTQIHEHGHVFLVASPGSCIPHQRGWRAASCGERGGGGRRGEKKVVRQQARSDEVERNESENNSGGTASRKLVSTHCAHGGHLRFHPTCNFSLTPVICCHLHAPIILFMVVYCAPLSVPL